MNYKIISLVPLIIILISSQNCYSFEKNNRDEINKNAATVKIADDEAKYQEKKLLEENKKKEARARLREDITKFQEGYPTVKRQKQKIKEE